MYYAKNISSNNHVFFCKSLVVNGAQCDINVNNKYKYLDQSYKNIADFINRDMCMFARPKQKHTNIAIFVDKPSFGEIVADGIVTNNPELTLVVRTSDCAPILFMDATNNIVGACHAGWRGALSGIIENTLSRMIEAGAKIDTIAVAVGPLLQKESFDCKQDMVDEFLKQDADFSRFFDTLRKEEYKFDFQNFIIHRLNCMGIRNISASDIDTFTNNDYFSHRKNTESPVGQASLIHL